MSKQDDAKAAANTTGANKTDDALVDPPLTSTDKTEKMVGKDHSRNSATSSSTVVTTDELIELVKAVKFAHPDMSIRNVHREITEKMSQQKSDDGGVEGEYAFLQSVKLNDVKKVWKKATFTSQADSGNTKPSSVKSKTATAQSSSTAGPTGNESTPVPQSLPITGGAGHGGGTVKLYTVGDGSIKTLAKNYAYHNAASEATKARAEEESTTQTTTGMTVPKETEEQIRNNYVHIFLDVPADRSGSRPHQALINFNENKINDAKSNSSSTSGKMSRAERRSQQRAAKKKGRSSSSKPPPPKAEIDELGRMIVKIQVAAAADGFEHIRTPMLLYNSDRTARTFVHPPSEDDDDDGAYDKIRTLISQSGAGGALGVTGGTKGYFYSRITKRSEGNDIISVDIASGLAPSQEW